jgi:hypothetical protein
VSSLPRRREPGKSTRVLVTGARARTATRTSGGSRRTAFEDVAPALRFLKA